ncbi:MAG: hypothetical protein CR984_05460 [Proteobacteria bacterium]|nr:MAG: hypothetical protein CR984_05460 [Pseudomonadota bacterium]
MIDHQEGASPDAAEGGCGSSEHAESAAGQSGQQGPPQTPGAAPATDPGPAGTMNAYDIPRYNSEGYILGRPEAANDPTSAGTVQGAAGGYQNPAQPSGSWPDPQAMANGGATMGQPGMQPHPQTMVYAGVDPATGRPVFMAQQAMAQPGMQPPPQGMVYAGVNPATGQPVFVAQQAMPGVQQPPTADEATAPGPDANLYGRLAEVVQDIANGEQPDVSKLAALYSSFDGQFWKGALIGAVLTVLLTNETVKNAAAGTLSGIMDAFKKDDGPVDGEPSPESE